MISRRVRAKEPQELAHINVAVAVRIDAQAPRKFRWETPGYQPDLRRVGRARAGAREVAVAGPHRLRKAGVAQRRAQHSIF